MPGKPNRKGEKIDKTPQKLFFESEESIKRHVRMIRSQRPRNGQDSK